MWWIWLIAAVLLGVVEMLTVDLIFLMLAGGAAAGAVVALTGAPIWVQALVAGLVALLLLAVVRPWAKTLLLRSTPDTPMNVRGLVGQIAITLVEVTDRSGLVKLAGEEWSARTAPGVMPRPVGEDVRVVEITGAHAIVAPLDAPTAGFGTAPQPTWSANSPATGPGFSNQQNQGYGHGGPYHPGGAPQFRG
ncbi:Putative activity regulator of membrane protease YbbK [Actinomycetales bacterium JB111]|nr:Putative activity regulator of membrane protease YbbK [Actinomycetales bacterium JB111]